MATIENQFVVVSDRGSSLSPFHSLKAVIAKSGHKQIYGTYERPPYPIIIDRPTIKDVISNLKFSDYVMGATLYTSGILGAYYVSRPFIDLSQKLLVYHGLSHISLVVGVSSMLMLSTRRLTGFYDNGLRWRRPEDRLRKFDNTSHYEKATIWRFINNSEK
eukprot:403342958